MKRLILALNLILSLSTFKAADIEDNKQQVVLLSQEENANFYASLSEEEQLIFKNFSEDLKIAIEKVFFEIKDNDNFKNIQNSLNEKNMGLTFFLNMALYKKVEEASVKEEVISVTE